MVHSFPSNGRVDLVIQKLNPILNGWCTYSGSATVTGHSIRWTGRFAASCSCGCGESISALGELLRSDGDINFSMNGVGFLEW